MTTSDPPLDVVDAHVHLLPAPLDARVRELFDRYLPGTVLYPIDGPRLLAELGDEGVRQAWSLPYAHRAGIAGWLNAETARLRDHLAHDRVSLVAGATVHPDDIDPAAIVTAAVRQHGARVLKLHSAVGDVELADPRLDPMWSVCTAFRLPVVVHVGHHQLGATTATELAAVDVLMAEHPHLRLVLAHLGHPAETTALELLEAHTGLYADLTPVASAHVEIPDPALRRFARRLLFGSDAPNTGVSITDLLGRILRAPLSDDERSAILQGNARRLVAEVDADAVGPGAARPLEQGAR